MDQTRQARYVNNWDGDSVTMLLDQGFYQTVQLNIRMANVWAPETGDPGGVLTKYYVQDWFMRQMAKALYRWPFLVVTYETKSGNPLKTFDRFVGDIVSKNDNSHLNSDVMRYIVEHDYTGGTGAPVRE